MEKLLARLHELAARLPRDGCDWEDRPEFKPGIEAGELAEIERSLPRPLPPDLRTFLQRHSAIVAMSFHNGYWIGDVKLLPADISVRQANITSTGNDAAIQVGTDGGGNAFLQTLSDGRVWKWDHETGSMTPVADSFTQFLERVADDWEHYLNDDTAWKYLT